MLKTELLECLAALVSLTVRVATRVLHTVDKALWEGLKTFSNDNEMMVGLDGS